MTQAELNFFTSVPKALREIASELRRLNTNLEKSTKPEAAIPPRASPSPPIDKSKPPTDIAPLQDDEEYTPF